MHIHSFGPDFTEGLFRAYEAVTDIKISWQRAALYHAISAFSAFADTADADPLLEQRRRWVAEVCTGPIAQMALAL